MAKRTTTKRPKYYHVAGAALLVAAAAPWREGKYNRCAYIPWRIVNEVRDELERAGLDWRAFKKQQEAEQ